MSFPVLTAGILNSIIFGAYSNGLDYFSQSQRSACRPASDVHIFAAGCFSGVMQVSSPEAVTVPDYAFGLLEQRRIPQFFFFFYRRGSHVHNFFACWKIFGLLDIKTMQYCAFCAVSSSIRTYITYKTVI